MKKHRASNNIKVLKRFLKEKNKKTYYQITKELIHCYYLERVLPDYYFIELLYKDKTRDYRNYVSHKKLNKVYDNINAKSNFKNLVNKVEFEKVLSAHNIPTPKTIAHNTNEVLHIGEDSIVIHNEDHLKKLINELVGNSKNDGIFIKHSGAHGGADTFKFEKGEISDDKILKLFNLIPDNQFVFQDLITQHNEINKIYGGSINTVRVNAFFDKSKNEVQILSALMRFGAGGSSVDNATQGGFFVPVNINEWKLEGIGRSFLKYGGYLYEKHPDTDFLLDGAIIPFGEQIPELLEKTAHLFDTRLIGWDIAITPEGPIIVEGNHNLHLGMAQMAQGGFKDHKGYMQLIKS